MRERYSYDREREHLPPYFGEAFDEQYCGTLLADAADADIFGKNVSSSGKERISFFKMAGCFVARSLGSMRPGSRNSTVGRNRPAA